MSTSCILHLDGGIYYIYRIYIGYIYMHIYIHVSEIRNDIAIVGGTILN